MLDALKAMRLDSYSMVEAIGNLWTYPADFRVITTNGSVRKDGCAVLGRGCAREAALKFPALPRELGAQLVSHGNRVYFFDHHGGGLFTFPVKHQWMEHADLDLIRESTESFARQLLKSCTYVMPRAGCGNGQLRWEDVRPILAVLPDNVVVIDFAR
jgi:hypothetical protein